MGTFLSWIGGGISGAAATGLVIGIFFMVTGGLPWEFVVELIADPPYWLTNSFVKFLLIIVGLIIIFVSLRWNLWSRRQKAIDDLAERQMLIECFEKTDKEVIEISEDQKQKFAGNMLQVKGHESYLVMSTSAYKSLNKEQLENIKKFNPIIHSNLDTIQACGGGSARCMMAEVFLPLSS